ncbi:hypothetical protein ASJ81_07635 [Methanosarcina spelaei]|uniref:DUF1673 domain-containing protein n=1 Tax=Methanosarcina spelaei TaxID=1036679 RepID=A0A2A2HRW7_9EURY|nr:DUF1673 domain-containing protein [Methanosarcina spelaei]PAV12197.1 hypothetical protein ASJ81_07635 [Methanosarcina spelaei]
MSNKTFVFDQIKKLMGWCPNAKAHEARQHVHLENFGSDIPDRARGENGNLKDSGWFRKESNQILLFSISLTFVYLLIYNQIGLNLIALLVGLLTSLFHFALYWNQRIQRYEAIAKKPIVRYVSEIKSLRGLLTIISLVLRISVLLFLSFVLLPRILEFDFKSAISIFISGLWFLMWGFYFQLIYWEKKNHMRIYIKSGNGFQKSYAIREKEGEK